MSILGSFKVFNFNEGVPYASITSHGLTFNKSVVMKLGYPAHVVLLIDETTKRIAIKKCEAETKNAVKFFKEKKSGVLSVRWNGRDMLNSIEAMMGWDLKNASYKVNGELVKEEDAMIFDLSKAHNLN